jgi:hypothetical protein
MLIQRHTHTNDQTSKRSRVTRQKKKTADRKYTLAHTIKHEKEKGTVWKHRKNHTATHLIEELPSTINDNICKEFGIKFNDLLVDY